MATESTEPSPARPSLALVASGPHTEQRRAEANSAGPVSFNRRELNIILNLYGVKVAAGEWRDYALDFSSGKAVFSVFRRASEAPLYRIEKNPELARRQGAYAVIAAGGLILRRGHDLTSVVRVLEKRLRLVGAE